MYLKAVDAVLNHDLQACYRSHATKTALLSYIMSKKKSPVLNMTKKQIVNDEGQRAKQEVRFCVKRDGESLNAQLDTMLHAASVVKPKELGTGITFDVCLCFT